MANHHEKPPQVDPDDSVALIRDEALHAVWVEMNYGPRGCFTPEMLIELGRAITLLRGRVTEEHASQNTNPLRFQVLRSTMPGVFGRGGDLDHFGHCIRSGDRHALRKYGRACIELVHAVNTHYQAPFTTIALVEGEALGGGFECALAHSVIVAEEQATFGFPEIRFGLFPGMGAVSFLSRKVEPGFAHHLISSGRIYTAQYLYDHGIVDILVPEGEGEGAVENYMRQESPGRRGIRQAFDIAHPVPMQELDQIVNVWVDCAMQISGRNLRLMKKLVGAQK